MPKQILMVFQDCYNCDSSKEWYDNQVAKAAEMSVTLVPSPHDFPGVKALILEAKTHGCEKLPFLTDGKKFSYDVAKFCDKAARKNAKKEAEVADGDIS